MRTTLAAALSLTLSACAAGPAAPYGRQGSLPYAACGDMAALRVNLTGAPDPTRESDAILRALGVRCVNGEGRPSAIRARF
jgi:hypothetical protein